VKVKLTLEQRESRGVVYCFFRLGASWRSVVNARPRPLSPGQETLYPQHRSLGGPQGRFGQLRIISPPPAFDPRNVYLVASYTDYAIPVHVAVGILTKIVVIVKVRGHCPFVLVELTCYSAGMWGDGKRSVLIVKSGGKCWGPSFIHFLFHGAAAADWPGPPHYRGFTVTLRHGKCGRIPLDQWSARRSVPDNIRHS
jgi:hypothetical protein